jgi:ABC-2 type transport system permease protein
MKKSLIILKREYITRVRTKAFVIGTLLTPLLMLVLTLLPGFLAMRGGGERHITILDQSGDPELYTAISRRLSPGSNGQDPAAETGRRPVNNRFFLNQVLIPPESNIHEIEKNYREQVINDSNKAYVILRPDLIESGQPEYYAKNTSDFSIGNVERAISDAIVERRLVLAGLDPQKLTGFMKSVEMSEQKVTEEGVSEESGFPGVIVAIVMLVFIYMSILMYGITVMRGVIEEKQSRIVEVLASSVKPTQMMMGKLVGIGLVGLTQYVIWVGSAAALTAIGASMAAASGVRIPRIPPSLLLYFIVFFVLGYFLYATLYAMVGAVASTEEEAQQIQMPVTMLIVVPMLLFGMVMNNPSSGLSMVLSLIPFFAPTLMMLRISLINPPMWQVLLSMAGMVLAILGSVWVAAKIYRVGILMYGKRPSIAELGRWLRYT